MSDLADSFGDAIEALDTDACDLLRKYLALGHSALILRLHDDGRYRILTPDRGSAILALVVDEIPALLESAAGTANELAKAGRKH